MSVTNRRVVEDDGADFYPTPAWATEALVANEKFEGVILEPACGDGSMAEVLKSSGYDLVCSDLHDHGYGLTGLNFLDTQAKYPNVITNPPYNIADDFAQKALEVAEKKVAFLVRLAYMEGQERHRALFSKHPPTRVYVFSERITFYKKGAEKKGNGTTAYCWVVWDKEDLSGKTELRWLAPIYKPKNTSARKKKS